MGYYVVTSGNAPELEGHAFADKYIAGDYSDKELMLKLVKENQIEGIISCANDFGTITAAYVAEQMGWPGHDTYENTLLLHHKDLFKTYCAKKNIPSVKSVVFEEIDTLLDYVKTCGYPIIVKANDLTGGKGISRANNYEEACQAARNAFEKSRDKQVLVEPFIEGTQHTAFTFVVGGKIVSATSCNCYSVVNPYLIQTETYPADYEDEDLQSISKIIGNIVEDLKLVDGVFIVQYMRREGQIYIIEIMRRLLGNLSYTLCEKKTGYPWHEAYIMSSLGMDCSAYKSKKSEAPCCGHHGIFALTNGVIDDYTIPEYMKKHIFKFVELIPRGERIDDHKQQRIASFLYTYDSKEEMEKEVKCLYDDIIVQMK